MAEPAQLVEQYLGALGDRDVERALSFYADDGAIVSYDGVAAGVEQLRSFLAGFLAAHKTYDLVSIDQMRAAHDLIVWDATMDTADGLLQVTNVVTLDETGKIARHVPGVRGYWGHN